MIDKMPKEIEDAVCGGADIPGVMSDRLTQAWAHYRILQPQATAGLAPQGSKPPAELSSFDPRLMSDSEHVKHFGFSARDEAIEREVRRRLSAPAPRTELTEADRKVCAQLGVSESDFLRAKTEERTETPTAPETFTLTAQDKAVCAATGVSEAEFLRVRTEERLEALEGVAAGRRMLKRTFGKGD